ncbi:MAG TPA: succinate dehydrogenase assembly factor 2 [Paenalcaligenes sp.]|nr:succinate dehydrogenase assembly factor 2 [Paenalcaligenes sp.]
MAELTSLQRARLRWRARRGMLENDLILTRFLDRYEHELTDVDVVALNKLFEMDDNDLLQVLLGTQELQEPYNSPEIQRLVALISAL